ncbi:MAG: diguanylate cyclase, partial [Nitrospirae bacterium]|nr:diguanylate cyclase [Nitrospirota bacterium]
MFCLLIENDPKDALLIAEMLSRSDPDISTECVERLADGIERISRGGIDVIILDINLPDSGGLETLDYVLDMTNNIPIIVIAGSCDDAFGMEAVRRGAQDYLVKGEIESRTLMRAISYAIERKKLEAALKSANELCSVRAKTDPLTGIYNRLQFNELLAAEIQRSRRYKTPLSLIMFDIDRFKKINDRCGHKTGDRVLVEMSSLVSENIRGPDIFARWGGEEFMIVVPNTGLENAFALAEKLRGLIEASNVV